jgi:hypothetical protein
MRLLSCVMGVTLVEKFSVMRLVCQILSRAISYLLLCQWPSNITEETTTSSMLDCECW